MSETNVKAETGLSWSLLDLIVEIWRGKRFMLWGGVLFGTISILYAILATPQYTVTAIVSSGNSEGAALLSGQLTAASRLAGGNSGLSKISVVAKSQKLLSTMIERHNLLPVLFEDLWDAERKQWKVKESEIPSTLKGVGILRKKITVLTDPAQTFLSLSIEHEDVDVALQWIDWYLELIEESIGDLIEDEVNRNLSYLSKQLAGIQDPILAARVTNLMGNEIQKGVLARSVSFQILDRPIASSGAPKPRRLMVILAGFFFGSCAGAVYAVASKLTRDLRRYFRDA